MNVNNYMSLIITDSYYLDILIRRIYTYWDKYLSRKLETVYFVIFMRKYESIKCILVDSDLCAYNVYLWEYTK